MQGRRWAALAALIGLLAWTNLAAAQEQPKELPPLAGGEIVEVRPGAADLTREQAEAAARQAVMKDYEVTERKLAEDYRAESMLYAFPEAKKDTNWSVMFYPIDQPPGGRSDYCVEMDGRTGEAWLVYEWWEDAKPEIILAHGRRERGMEKIWGQRIGDAHNPGWTLEQQAAFDAWATEIGVYPDGIMACVLPAAGDIPQEEALELAEQAMMEKYGWEKGRFERYSLFASLRKGTEFNIWRIQLTPKAGSPEVAEGGCRIKIESPGGKILEIHVDWENNG